MPPEKDSEQYPERPLSMRPALRQDKRSYAPRGAKGLPTSDPKSRSLKVTRLDEVRTAVEKEQRLCHTSCLESLEWKRQYTFGRDLLYTVNNQ